MDGKTPTTWISGVCAEDLEAAAEDSFVDAYGDHEQHTGVLTMIEERLAFPFRAKVIGKEVSVVAMEWPDDDEFGLDLVVLGEDGKRYRIAARSVEPVEPFPDGIEFLALYLDWRGRF